VSRDQLYGISILRHALGRTTKNVRTACVPADFTDMSVTLYRRQRFSFAQYIVFIIKYITRPTCLTFHGHPQALTDTFIYFDAKST
jgi:hypothetical protein